MHAVRAMVLFSYIYLIIIFKRLICIWVRLRGCDWSEQQPRAHFYFPLLALRDSRVLRTFQKYHVIPLFFIFSFDFFSCFSFYCGGIKTIQVDWNCRWFRFWLFFFPGVLSLPFYFFLLRRIKFPKHNGSAWRKLPSVPSSPRWGLGFRLPLCAREGLRLRVRYLPDL